MILRAAPTNLSSLLRSIDTPYRQVHPLEETPGHPGKGEVLTMVFGIIATLLGILAAILAYMQLRQWRPKVPDDSMAGNGGVSFRRPVSQGQALIEDATFHHTLQPIACTGAARHSGSLPLLVTSLANASSSPHYILARQTTTSDLLIINGLPGKEGTPLAQNELRRA